MIDVEHLTRYYGTTPALVEVTFSIDERAVVGFLGLNGAGKSTLLEILSGLLLPSAGRVVIDGVDAVEAPDSLRSRIGHLPEEPPLYEEMRVEEFLTWCGRLKGRSRSEVDRRLPWVADTCEIGDVLDRVIASLSHGYRKRVGIAQAIVHDPTLVVLDEPLAGLDPVQIVEMREVLRRLREECTVLISSHILAEISQTCDRILVLHDGELVADGTERELARRLGGGLRLRIALRGSRPKIEAVFEAEPRLANWEHRDGEEDVSEYLVRLEEDVRERFVAALADAGIGVRRLEEAGSELEEAFLGVTGQSGAAEAREIEP